MDRVIRVFAVLGVGLVGCGSGCDGGSAEGTPVSSSATPVVAPEHPAANPPAGNDLEGGTVEAGPPPAGMAVATFAGGCFWCMEAAFEHVRGVQDAISGYTGGPELHPSYEQVSEHGTGHAEAIRVIYDPSVVTYEQLLDVYWRHVDPIHPDQGFVDRGHQYRSVIYVHDAQQRA